MAKARASKKKTIQIPFKGKAMMEYTAASQGEVAPDDGWGRWGMPTEWRDNCEFKAELRLTGHYRGRSAARVRVTNCDNDEEYSLGLSAFYDAVKNFGAMDGTLVGTWTFRKQGSNYGVYPVVPVETREEAE